MAALEERQALLQAQQLLQQREQERDKAEKAERGMLLAKQVAERANEAKAAFLSTLSHELRTPLNAILGFCRLMRNAKDVTPKQTRHLDIINNSGEHLLHLINNVLDLSKIESGRMTLEETNFDLHKLLHEILSMMHVRAVEKGLGFTMVLSPALPRYVTADAGKLRQVLINLVGNAIKFTSSGGVFLRAEAEPQESTQPARVRFEVEDSGPGIHEQDRNRIFAPFEQLNDAAGSGKGTGLGLQQTNQQLTGEIAQRKVAEAALAVALTRMQALSERITRGQEEERHRIAYELHEQLGQELASVNVYLTLLKPHCSDDEAKARLQDARGMIELMMKRIREMSLHLRPSQLDTFGLYVALRAQCTEQSTAAGWELHFDAPQSGQRPQPDVETACFRLVQEALANIEKHANATEVWVSLVENGDELRLRVRDNGRGFNVAEIQNGPERDNLGLIGMAERARQVGGRVDFESSPGDGTEVRAVFPQLASS